MRAGIVFILCLGLASVASAQGNSVPGVPRDVVVWEPGLYSVVSSAQTVLRRDNDDLTIFNQGDVAGTFASPARPECFTGITGNGDLVLSPALCWPPGNIVQPEIAFRSVRAARFTPSGTGYVMAQVEQNDLLLLHVRPGEVGTTPWNPLTFSGPSGQQPGPTGVMAVTETDGGVPHAIFLTGSSQLLWFKEDKQEAEVDLGTDFRPEAVALFSTGGDHPIALYGMGTGDGGIFRAQLTPAASVITDAFTRVPLLGEDGGDQPFHISSLAVNTGSGSELGEGFGVAVGTLPPDSELVVLGAVPADSAGDAGTLWRVREGIDVHGMPVEDLPVLVDCVDSTYCVIVVGRESDPINSNLAIYRNDSAPSIEGGTSSLRFDEGDPSIRVPFSATDGDGDPVRMSMDASTALAFMDVSAQARPDAIDVALTPREVCQDSAATVWIYASDGLKAHDQGAGLSVTVENTRNLAQPGVEPASALTYGEPQVFTAQPAAGLCTTVGYQWTSAPELAADGGATATFTPPLNVLCSAAGGSYAYSVRGLDEGRLLSAPTNFSVAVSPWGRPLPPFGPDARRALSSGPDAGVDLAPEVLHTCIRDLGLPREQLPALETVWSLTDATAGVPAGLTFRGADGGTVSLQPSVASDVLRVEAAECTNASLSLTARNRILTGDGGVDGPAATVQVDVQLPPEDFANAQLALRVAENDNSAVEVGFGTPLRCDSEQVRARMALEAPDGTVLDSEDVPVPGPWRPALPAVCAGTYTVRGTLVDQRATRERLGDQETTTLTVGPRLEALEGDALVARCGEGVRAQLTQPIAPDTCTGLAVTWTQVGTQPQLLDAPLTGETVTVDSPDSTPLEELVGQSVTLRVTAGVAQGSASTREHVLPITAEPFVDVRHALESSTGSEQGLVGVVVELSNTTACEVGRLSYVERVEGLEPVPGTVKLDGQPLVETAMEGGFTVEGLRLAARATGRLTYVGRPQLLATPRFSGEVFLNRVPVSGGVPPPSSSGCGCSGGGPGAAAFGLAALVRLLRRRRDARA